MIGAGPGEPGMDLLGALAAGRLDPAAGASAARSPHAAADGPERPVCSRRGCTAEATWALEWNNPRVHAPDRVKTWLACADHRPFLDDFLSARGFLRRSRPLDPPATEAPEVETPETPQEPPRP
ncbi:MULTISPECIES: hypothetical protein [Micrococcus]|uniref:hypothetical protein n=1 Tax=Micrococcus TaxID=1269 RepID=UPI00190FFBEF|nr:MULTISPECIES: hypothetical protein [Micrococcus]QQE48293.1 hypothetical protein I6H91_09095 [Micrococcus luteus]QTP19461.1 hypothetical protein J7660_05500 [Micrococcus luteus]